MGRPFDLAAPEPFLDECAGLLTVWQPRSRIVMSAGKQGAHDFADRAWDHCPTLTVPMANTAGAGDALSGGIIACLGAGLPLTIPGPPRVAISDRRLASALGLGVLLAALSVTSPHTIHPEANVRSLCASAREMGLESAGDLWGALSA